MPDRNNWEQERTRDRGHEYNRENWGRGREEERDREMQLAGGEERNRNWEREGRYTQGGGEGNRGYGNEGGRQYEGSRDPYYSGTDVRGNEGRWNEGRGSGGYGGERGYEAPRGYEGSRGHEGSRGYNANQAYEGSRGGYEGARGGYEGGRGEEGWRSGGRQGDYGPGAFNRQFRGGTEYFGTGQRGYGTTWGGTGSGTGNSSSYSGGQGGFSGGIGTYGDQGRFAGKGPKGYQRSDERIREDICERLTHHPEIDAEEIEIVVKGGEVTLTGTVQRRDEKRFAEDAAESVSGVKDVHNQLRMQHHQGSTTGQGMQSNKQETAGAGSQQKTK